MSFCYDVHYWASVSHGEPTLKQHSVVRPVLAGINTVVEI